MSGTTFALGREMVIDRPAHRVTLWLMTRGDERMHCEIDTQAGGIPYVRLTLNGEFLSAWRQPNERAARAKGEHFRKEHLKRGWHAAPH